MPCIWLILYFGWGNLAFLIPDFSVQVQVYDLILFQDSVSEASITLSEIDIIYPDSVNFSLFSSFFLLNSVFPPFSLNPCLLSIRCLIFCGCRGIWKLFAFNGSENL